MAAFPPALVEALQRVTLLLAEKRKKTYHYEVQNVKKWELGPGGRSGNCDVCVDNADLGWVLDDDIFESEQYGDIDGPPAHEHCECFLTYSTRRVRVY